MPVNLIDQYRGAPKPHINLPLLKKRSLNLLCLLNKEEKLFNLVFINNQSMAEFNSKFRQKNQPTNVLSFPAGADNIIFPDQENELGDVLICVDVARDEANQQNSTVHQRLSELIIHGLLHLLGWDHERSEAEALSMWEFEKELFQRLTECSVNNHSKQANRKKTQGREGKNMPHLAINVDHIATIREARGINEPDPVTAAAICELAGARGIVVHLREDRRHIQDRDVQLLRQTIKTKLNLEMAAAKEIINIAIDIKPDLVTLVPEKRKELTTEGGLDIVGNEKKLKKSIEKMTKAGIPVSIFIDPDASQIEAAVAVGATFIELHTGRYCDAVTDEEQSREFRLIEQSAELGFEAGLRVNAGHGLDYRNTAMIAALPTIEELSIGHAVISRAVLVGLDQAVREMLDIIKTA
jgi:pyridoxine 5-phosphate synthase